MYLHSVKRIGTFLFIILISTLLLIGSSGFTIGKMICGGNECIGTDYSLGKAKDCCDGTATSDKTEVCCCELINVSYILDNFNPSEKIIVSPQQVDFPYLTSGILHLSFVSSCAKKIFFVSDLPPPHTKELLFTFCSLLL